MLLDPERKYNGFETLEEIYDWIISSKSKKIHHSTKIFGNYNTELFLLENLTQTDRKRNRKRPTFNKFLEYVKDIPYVSEGFHFEKNKTKYLDLIDQSFPEINFLDQINILKKKDEKYQKIKTKFNGRLVMEWTNLQDKELGHIITEFKKIINDTWLSNHSADEIKIKFLEWYFSSKSS